MDLEFNDKVAIATGGSRGSDRGAAAASRAGAVSRRDRPLSRPVRGRIEIVRTAGQAFSDPQTGTRPGARHRGAGASDTAA
jgi:hypothetical protein